MYTIVSLSKHQWCDGENLYLQLSYLPTEMGMNMFVALVILDIYLSSSVIVQGKVSDNVIFSTAFHDDVIKWKHFPRHWPFVREIHRSPVNSPHKGQWRGALMFSLSKQWWGWWFETPPSPWWCHCNVRTNFSDAYICISKLVHHKYR